MSTLRDSPEVIIDKYPNKGFIGHCHKRMRYSVGLFVQIPFLGYLVFLSRTLLSYALSSYRDRVNYNLLYWLLDKTLRSSTIRKSPKDWWFFMRLAISLTQERQIKYAEIDMYQENKLIEHGDKSPGCFHSYDMAYSIVGFSLWYFERGELKSAIEKIKEAGEINYEWAYPEYLLGWYGLFTPEIDPVPHFTRAVNTDWAFLQRLKHDRVCQQFPDVLKQVRQNVVIHN